MPKAMSQNLEVVPDCLKIGDWQFRVTAHELERNGNTVRLEPRAASLLLYLATRAGKPVSRQALLEALWPGMVVSDEALTNAVNKLRRAFGDDRANPRVIETIPKAGYRLIAPVQSLAPAATSPMPDDSSMAVGRWLQHRWLMPAVVSVVVAMMFTVFFTALHQTVTSPLDSGTMAQDDSGTLNSRPAVAVLPFDNLSAETTEEYLVDGVTDDVITRLAKTPGLMVIARDSTFFYKGKTLEPRTIAETLGVGYVLRGSVRREGNMLKINAWLVDIETGDHAWAEHYERKVGQIFDIQNEISSGVIMALTGTKDTGHPDTSMETENPEAYDNLLLGRYFFYKFKSRAENLKARAYFEEAVRLDPGFATAHAMLAWTYAFEAMNGWTEDHLAALQQAEDIATRAIEIQQELPLAYFVRGLSYREQHEYVKALVEAQKAIEYDPNYANGYVLLATLLYYAGRPEEGLKRIREAMQINPHHPYNYHFHLGQAYFVLHRYQEAIDAFNNGLSSNPASERMRVWLAASLAYSGDIEAAQWEAQQIVAANPDFSLQRMAHAFPFKDPDDADHFIAGLRLAGLQ
jgi:TolB-like protein/DNA-binding winged helix-turn-helix (wHTH) protein/Tfp pilus assembly protein PilF